MKYFFTALVIYLSFTNLLQARTCTPFEFDMKDYKSGGPLESIKVSLPSTSMDTSRVRTDASIARMGLMHEWYPMSGDPLSTVFEGVADINGYFDSISDIELAAFNSSQKANNSDWKSLTKSDIQSFLRKLNRHLSTSNAHEAAVSAGDMMYYPEFIEVHGDDAGFQEYRDNDRIRVERTFSIIDGKNASRMTSFLNYRNSKKGTKPYIERKPLPLGSSEGIGNALPALCYYITYNAFNGDFVYPGSHDVHIETYFMDQIATKATETYKNTGEPPAAIILADGQVTCRIKPSEHMAFYKREGANCEGLFQTSPVIRATKNTNMRYLQFGHRAYWTTCSSTTGEQKPEWLVGDLGLISTKELVSTLEDSKVLSALIKEPTFKKIMLSQKECSDFKSKMELYISRAENIRQKQTADDTFSNSDKRNFQNFCSQVLATGKVDCQIAMGTTQPSPVDLQRVVK